MEEWKTKSLRIFQQMDRTRKAWHNIAPCPEVSKSEFATLMTIAHGGAPMHSAAMHGQEPQSITLSALAAVMHQSLPAISQRVTILEEQGYLQRHQSLADRRVTAVSLTESGRALLQKAHTQFALTMDRALHTMTTEEKSMLMELLGKLADALEEIGENSGAPCSHSFEQPSEDET